MTEYPLIRQTTVCPCCNKPKPRGNIVCWGCYRHHDMRHGFETHFAATLENLEAQLGQNLLHFLGVAS